MKPRRGDMNWLALETEIRAQLKTANDHTDTKDFALIIQAIDQAIGDYTGRGYELDGQWWKRFEA